MTVPHFEGLTDPEDATLLERGEAVLHYQVLAATRTATPVLRGLGQLVCVDEDEDNWILINEDLVFHRLKGMVEVFLNDPKVDRVTGLDFVLWKAEPWTADKPKSVEIALVLT